MPAPAATLPRVKALLEPLLNSPQLPEHFDELARVLAAERGRRMKFYEEVTEDGKWEFINGQSVMQSPATVRHARASDRLFRLISTYVDRHRLGEARHEKLMCSFPRNDYEPDIAFFGPAKAHVLNPEMLLVPVPDFIAEVLSPSTEKHDRGVKFEDYAAHGVGEYWLVDPAREAVEVFRLAGRTYQPAGRPARRGELSSSVITGFTVAVRAIFDDEANLAAMRRILA